MAGNVVPYLADGTLPRVLDRLAAHLAPGGYLVSGFGLRGSLPAKAAAGGPAHLRPARRGGRAVVHRALLHLGRAAVRAGRHVRRLGAPADGG